MLFTISLLQIAHSVNVNSHCIDGRVDGCVYDQQYLPVSKYDINNNRVGLSQQEAQILCQQNYGSNLATIDTSITHLISISDQFSVMRDSCDLAGPNQACWTSAIRDINDPSQFILDNNFIISSDRNTNFNLYNEYFLAENEGNGNNEDCIALYHAKNYFMSDWPCDDTNGVKIALCNNPKYDINNECLCKCNKCTSFGDPHIYTFDDLYYHAIVKLI